MSPPPGGAGDTDSWGPPGQAAPKAQRQTPGVQVGSEEEDGELGEPQCRAGGGAGHTVGTQARIWKWVMVGPGAQASQAQGSTRGQGHPRCSQTPDPRVTKPPVRARARGALRACGEKPTSLCCGGTVHRHPTSTGSHCAPGKSTVPITLTLGRLFSPCRGLAASSLGSPLQTPHSTFLVTPPCAALQEGGDFPNPPDRGTASGHH